ncbi:hypothetical protein CVS40_11137 [Lucilia cuprina]|nr:hypothetical protein CVS40_11137 [Lucilia cuprina]
MERQHTRPLAPGKIKSYLRRTAMPKHVPPFLPPFEARPKIHSVERAPLAKSGTPEVDDLARKVWEKRIINPLHTIISKDPPPLAPLSNHDEATPSPSITLGPVPALQPINRATNIEDEVVNTEELGIQENPPQEAWTEQDQEDLLNDILNLNAPELSEEEDSDDPFRGIVINAPRSAKLSQWMIYPKGRPKVQIISSTSKVCHTEQRSDEETPYIDNEYENVSTSSYFYETDDDISEATSVKSNLD